MLPSHLSADADLKARFEREAKAISQLTHPHICTLHDVGNHEGVEYLVMELLEGQTLSERLEKGALPTEQVLKFGVEIADALDKAHRAGIVHRDLKPGNVMITKSGVKLLDFGLAKAVGSRTELSDLSSLPTEAERPLTERGTILGTFQYMSPEQLEGKEADPRSDIFAFGCVLYEMATGRKAFTGASRVSLISSILRDDPRPISAVAPMTPRRSTAWSRPASPRIRRTAGRAHAMSRASSRGSPRRGRGREHPRPLSRGERPGRGLAGGSPPARRSWRFCSVFFCSARCDGRQSGSRESYGPVSPERRRASCFEPMEDPRDLAGWLPARLQRCEGRDFRASAAIAGFRGIGSDPRNRRRELPFFSPDGKWIGFVAGPKLKKVALAGGTPVTLCDAPIFRGATWGEDR